MSGLEIRMYVGVSLFSEINRYTIFKGFQLFGKRRLCHMQKLCGAGHVFFPCNGKEVSESPYFHRHVPFVFSMICQKGIS